MAESHFGVLQCPDLVPLHIDPLDPAAQYPHQAGSHLLRGIRFYVDRRLLVDADRLRRRRCAAHHHVALVRIIFQTGNSLFFCWLISFFFNS